MTRVAVRSWTWAMAVLIVGAAAGCHRSPEVRANPVADAMRAGTDPSLDRAAAEGRRIFLATCATCHGDTGRGDGQNASRLTPRPPDLQSSLRTLPATDMRRIVESGSAAVGRSPLCPPHARDLGAEGIDAVLAYLQTIGRDRVKAGAARAQD